VWETKKEQSDAILFDLKESKRILEEKTQKPILHLAYPWGIGSNLSVKLCKDAGYLSNFWGPTHGIPYNKVGSDPYKLIRLKDDYIFRLPGKGRISLGSVFLKKFIRRTTAKQKGKDIY
jgi:hypothetical protein